MTAPVLHSLDEELESELRNNILAWWMEHGPDPVNGGFRGHIDRYNREVKGAGKGSVLNARILWTFSAAYRMFGELSYLETARLAWTFFSDHFIDTAYGGVYWELDPSGRVLNDRKQVYAIAFAIYGLSEFHLATGNREALELAKQMFGEIEEHALDRQRNGYTEALSRDWKPLADLRLSEKDQNESKTMNTHLHILEAYTNLFRAWPDEGVGNAIRNLSGLFTGKFIDPETFHLRLFFDDGWTLRSSLISYGHDIECSWLLYEAATVTGDPALMEKTGKLAVAMAGENLAGLDSDGGLFYEFFPEEGRLDKDKHWWPQAEALVGYYNAYELSGNEVFAAKTRSSWDFIRGYLIDREYGEWFWSTDMNGVPSTEREKAGFWKCPYHNSRACMELIRRIREPG